MKEWNKLAMPSRLKLCLGTLMIQTVHIFSWTCGKQHDAVRELHQEVHKFPTIAIARGKNEGLWLENEVGGLLSLSQKISQKLSLSQKISHPVKCRSQEVHTARDQQIICLDSIYNSEELLSGPKRFTLDVPIRSPYQKASEFTWFVGLVRLWCVRGNNLWKTNWPGPPKKQIFVCWYIEQNHHPC